jgi:hypothetical protein
MVVFLFTELRNLIHLFRACHQPVSTDEVLELGRVDQRFAPMWMSEWRLIARRQKRDLERCGACDGCAQRKARREDHDVDYGDGRVWRRDGMEERCLCVDRCVAVAMTLTRASR